MMIMIIDDDVLPVVVAVPGKAQAFAVYIYTYIYIYMCERENIKNIYLCEHIPIW